MPSRSLLLCGTMLLAVAVGKAQVPDYAASSIPDSLRRNAGLVIRLDRTDYRYDSSTSALRSRQTVITLLNRGSEESAAFRCDVDMYSSLKSFSGAIYDAEGKEVRKLHKGDLKYTEYSDHLATDAAYYWLVPPVSSYPCTVKYEYEIAHKDGFLGALLYAPLSIDIGVALQKAQFRLSVPAGYEFSYKCMPCDKAPAHSTDRKYDVYEWNFAPHKAMPREPLLPSVYQRVPLLYLAPSDFSYDDTHGNMQDWKHFGAWMSQLLAGRDMLPPAAIAEVRALTDTIPDRRAKIKALYDLLGRTTRYVSIQLGIGGWQPIDATTVYNTKFGDCKALSNYLKAMLTVCGIPSFYTIIHTEKRHVPRDFATLAVANHAILGVPCDNDTLWLECTSPDVPCGYVHRSTAGHDAVIAHDGTAEVVTLPSYADSLNYECQWADVQLADNGDARLNLRKISRARQYEWMSPLVKLSSEKQRDFVRENMALPLVEIDSLDFDQRKDMPLPEIEIRAAVKATRYANRTGTRLFVPAAPLRQAMGRLASERTQDLWIESGYCDVDSLTLHLPDGFVIEAIPEPIHLSGPFGSIDFEVRESRENELSVHIRMLRHSGLYPKSDYEAFKSFIQAINRAYSARIVLRREQ